MDPRTTIPESDRFLAGRGMTLEAILTGGAALAMLGVISRETRDCDLLEPELPQGSLGRPELLLTKLWALCDRGLDLGDCLALHPNREELARAAAWIIPQDLNPDWPRHVQSTLQDLARRLDHGV